MKKEYIIENVHCADCARSLELALGKIDGIKNAKINFVRQRMTLEFEDNVSIEMALNKVDKLVSSFSAKVTLIELTTEQPKSLKNNKKHFSILQWIDLSIFLAGLVLGLVCILVNMNRALFFTLVVISALLMGYKTYYKAIKLLTKGVVNENLLLLVSVFGAIVINQAKEGLMVVALYSIGKFLEDMAVDKSRKNISELMQLAPEYAEVKVGATIKQVKIEDVTVGSVMLVRPGERVPLDGIILKGGASLDIKHITGESIPVYKKENEEVVAGSIVLDGALEITTTTTAKDSTISKILNLIENSSENKSKTESFISKFASVYTLVVIGLAILTGFIVSIVTKDISEGVYRGLSFLVVACPCAFAISVPLSYFSGIGNASKRGILVKGSNFLDISAKIKTVAFDKTGTLTTGNFEVLSVESLVENFSMIDILKFACFGEQYSNHPIAKAIMRCGADIKLREVKDFKEIAGEGVSYTFANQTIFVGKQATESNDYKTKVVVKVDGEIVGEIFLADKIKDSSYDTIKWLNKNHIKTIMLSGDNEKVAKEIAEELNINEYKSSMTPEEKYNYLTDLKKQTNGSVAYVGDGINDAPSLANSDIGISMGINGSDSSIEASDVVIADDNPHQVVSLIKVARHTKKIVIENIVFALSIKVLFLALSAFGITKMLFAVFADVGVTLIAVLNSMRALFYKFKGEK
ncbi:MAG: heavy metal translocating P-type ATPase [Christensenellales bacterium]